MSSIIAGAVVMFAVGAVWFTVLFGKLWSRLMQFTPEASAKAKAGGMGGKMVMMFVLNIVSVSVVYCLLPQLLLFSSYELILSVSSIWLGFTLPSLVNAYLWEGKSLQLVAINAGGSLLSFILGGLTVYFMM